MRFYQWAVGLALFVVLLGGAGCAGGAPDLHGPEGPALIAAYSGDWVLDADASDNLGEELRAGLQESPGGLPPGMTGGRRVPFVVGGRPGSASRGAMMGGRGGTPMDPEAMKAAANALRTVSQVPAELTLTLQPDRVALTEGGSVVTVIPLGARSEDLVQAGVKVLGSAQWKKEGVVLTREFDPTGTIKDTFSLDDAGSLLLRREVDFLSLSITGTLVYHRND